MIQTRIKEIGQQLGRSAGNSALFVRMLKRYWFPIMTRKLQREGEDKLFFNFGYEEDPPMGLPLEESDEPNRLWIQLYHRVGAQVDLSGKDVLEVSCGHGGGASYLTRTLHPASYTGLDFNGPGIAFCKKRHNVPGLRFVHGDAQNLPFPDRSFDVVLNLEASHIYADFERFLGEVVRVLRPGGYFLYADFRGRDAIPAWEASLAKAPMQLVSQEDINAEILRGLDAASPGIDEMITRLTPAWGRQIVREHGYLVGSQGYKNLETGDMVYRAYSFVRD